MFRIRDPRSLFRFTAIYSYLMLGWNILNIWNYVQLGYTRLMVIEIVKASIAFICGFIFYTYSMLNLVTVIKRKNLLWIPAIALLFSDILCSIFAIFSIISSFFAYRASGFPGTPKPEQGASIRTLSYTPSYSR